MTLRQQQSLFVRMVGQLIEHAYSLGYELTFGEAWRTPEQARLNAASGKGIANSLHIDRLAIDFNLFRDGKFLSSTEDHAATATSATTASSATTATTASQANTLLINGGYRTFQWSPSRMHLVSALPIASTDGAVPRMNVILIVLALVLVAGIYLYRKHSTSNGGASGSGGNASEQRRTQKK